MNITFSYLYDYCPNRHTRLKVYRTDERSIKSVNGESIAIHRIMICPVDKRRFRSEQLDLMIPPKCMYANDVMVESAIQGFINGRSSSEISSLFGVSESHARRLSNKTLGIFGKIQEENIPTIKKKN